MIGEGLLSARAGEIDEWHLVLAKPFENGQFSFVRGQFELGVSIRSSLAISRLESIRSVGHAKTQVVRAPRDELPLTGDLQSLPRHFKRLAIAADVRVNREISNATPVLLR